MDFSHWFLLVFTLLVLYNLGVIWFVQLVVYPLFTKVGSDDYVAYHMFYLSRIPLPGVIGELIRYNWPRTLGITGSAFLTIVMLTLAFSPV